MSCAVSVARADTEQQKEADALFQEGRSLLVAGNNEAACAKFDQAIKLDPTADGIMLNLGLCNENLGRYKTALDWFRKAQIRASETNLPENERVAREHTSDLATKVATVRIEIAGTVDGAKVKIDGDVVKPEDYGHAEVDPGHHALEAGAPGMKNVHQDFEVNGKGGDTLTITFIAGDNTIVRDPGKGRRRTALFVAAGGGVLMAASVGLSLYELHVKNQNEVMCKAGQQPFVDTCNHANWVAHWYGTGLFIAGAGAVSAAAYLYFTAPQREVIDQTVWAPTVSPDGIGIAATGRF